MDLDMYYDKISRLWPEPGQSPTKDIVDICLAAVAEYPESSTFWYDLGIVMQRCDDSYGYTAADYLRCFEKSIGCNCENAEAYQELGYVLDIYFDDYGKAEQAFKRALEIGAGHESYFGLARVLAQAGKKDDAIVSLAEGNCPFHDHPEISKLRAEILDGDWCWDA